MKENKEILEILSEAADKIPHLRFMQLLVAVGILEGPNDRFYEKSADTLARLKAAKETLNF